MVTKALVLFEVKKEKGIPLTTEEAAPNIPGEAWKYTIIPWRILLGVSWEDARGADIANADIVLELTEKRQIIIQKNRYSEAIQIGPVLKVYYETLREMREMWG